MEVADDGHRRPAATISGTARAAASVFTVTRTSSLPAACSARDLGHRPGHVGGVGVGHGLDDDRPGAPHRDPAHVHARSSCGAAGALISWPHHSTVTPGVSMIGHGRSRRWPAITEPPPSSTRRAPVLEAIAREPTRQMARGLVGEPSSLKMLRTFTRQPLRAERGRVVGGGLGRHQGPGRLHRARRGRVGPRSSWRRCSRSPSAGQARRAGAGARSDRAGGRPRGPGPGQSRLRRSGSIYSYPARLERIDRAVALASTKGWA